MGGLCNRGSHADRLFYYNYYYYYYHHYCRLQWRNVGAKWRPCAWSGRGEFPPLPLFWSQIRLSPVVLLILTVPLRATMSNTRLIAVVKGLRGRRGVHCPSGRRGRATIVTNTNGRFRLDFIDQTISFRSVFLNQDFERLVLFFFQN